MEKVTLLVDKGKFIDWYFDENTVNSTVDLLIKNGTVTLQDCLKDVGYLPFGLILNKEVIRQEDRNEEDEEIEEPGAIYNLVFKE